MEESIVLGLKISIIVQSSYCNFLESVAMGLISAVGARSFLPILQVALEYWFGIPFFSTGFYEFFFIKLVTALCLCIFNSLVYLTSFFFPFG